MKAYYDVPALLESVTIWNLEKMKSPKYQQYHNKMRPSQPLRFTLKGGESIPSVP